MSETGQKSNQAWAAEIRRTRHIGDFSRWKEQDAYYQAFERLLRDLRMGGKMNQDTYERSNSKSRKSTWIAVLVIVSTFLIVLVIIASVVVFFIARGQPENKTTKPDPGIRVSIYLHQNENCIIIDENCIMIDVKSPAGSVYYLEGVCQFPTCPPSPPSTVISISALAAPPTLTPSPTSVRSACQLQAVPPPYQDFISALCQEICYTDKFSQVGKSAIINLYEDPSSTTFLQNKIIILFIRIRIRPDELERTKVLQQLIYSSRSTDQQYNEVAVDRIEVKIPVNEGEPQPVFIAIPPEWKPKEGNSLFVGNSEPIVSFDCY